MKNKLKSIRMGSKSAAASQPKTSRIRSEVYPAPSTSPCIALFPEGVDSASEEVIDLSKADYAALKRAAAPSGSGILMFMANAALEKAVRVPVKSARMDAHYRLQDAVNRAVALLKMIAAECVKDGVSASGTVWDTFGAGIVDLAHGAASELNLEFNEAWEECVKANMAEESPSPRRAA